MTHQFMWCRQEVAENCISNSNHAHIAITSPEGRTITPKCGRVTINLKFYDLDPAQIVATKAFENNPKKGEEIIAGCMKDDHAHKIVDFVKGISEKTVVVVNCEAGISRSPAVVMAMRKFYGGDHDECFREAFPNIHVANMLGKVLGIDAFEAPKYNRVVHPFMTKSLWRPE